MSKRTKKTFSAVTQVKALARERIGAPRPGQVIRRKIEKRKPTLGQLLAEG